MRRSPAGTNAIATTAATRARPNRRPCRAARARAASARPPAAAEAARERRVLDVLRQVAHAEETLRARGTVDRNGDHLGEHGTVGDLAAAGLLADVPGTVEGEALLVEGYRVTA